MRAAIFAGGDTGFLFVNATKKLHILITDGVGDITNLDCCTRKSTNTDHRRDHSYRAYQNTRWRNGQVEVTITIPPNSSASVELPAARVEQVMENGVHLGHIDGVVQYEQGDGLVRLSLGSGAYEFPYPIH